MRERFATWISKRGAFDDADRAAFRARANGAGLRGSELGDGLLIGARRAAAPHASSIVVGDIFARESSKPATDTAVAAAVSCDATLGTLIDRFWGSYVIIGGTGSERFALRSPFGDLACYWFELDDRLVLASSMDLLRAFGAPRPAVDWTELTRFLLATEFRRGTTCLTGVGNLPGGHALRLSGGRSMITSLWSPWRFVPTDRHGVTRAAAAAALRTAISRVVTARTSKSVPSALYLSGGLDSSIVAAALKAANHPFVCLNMVSADPDGDERVYARAVADHFGTSLTEVTRDLAVIDLGRPLSPWLPHPTGQQFRQASEAAARTLATASGADRVLDGGGGDNMFCSLQSAKPLLDRVAVEGLGAGAVSTARDIAMLAEVSVASVTRRALARRFTRDARYRWPVDGSFMSADAHAGAGSFLHHAWLDPADGALPGEAAQIALLLAASALADSCDGEEPLLRMSPLVAQPIAEAALAAPTWLWFENGRNRAIARRAFADMLPTLIATRRSKGTPASFMASIVEAQRDRLRTLLLGGLLARQGLIDNKAISAWLAAPGPARDLGFARLLQLADAEAWARHWH